MMKQLRIYSKARMILALLIVLLSRSVFAQTSVVQGVVRDDKGVITGATVKIKGETNAVVTNVNGNYKISVSPNATIVVSFVGYNNKELNLKDYKPKDGVYTIDVDMEAAAGNLDEVVVVGFATQKKADLTGAVGA